MFVYLDTETTGRGIAWGDKIVEISIVGKDGEVLLDTLVDPERDIPWEVTQIHGITNEMCKGYPTIEELLPQINSIIKDKKVVIYNSNYDVQFFPDKLEQADEILCAMRAYAKSQETNNKRWVKLAEAAVDVGHEWDGNAHRSLSDTQACRSVWVWLLNNDEILNKTYKSELEINSNNKKDSFSSAFDKVFEDLFSDL